MLIKGIIFIIAIGLILFLYLVHNAMIKPTYNKMHNMWQEDPVGRNIADFTLVTMLVISFVLGVILF
jgi:hypothetical protein